MAARCAYRPDVYDDALHLADGKTKLLRHLNKRIADKQHAAEIYRNITLQVEDYSVRSATEMSPMMDLAIKKTDAGEYDNVTVVAKLELPAKLFYAPKHYPAIQTSKQTSYSPSIYLLIPISIAAFMLAALARSYYRIKLCHHWTFFVSSDDAPLRDSCFKR